jgi:hypothetical protein
MEVGCSRGTLKHIYRPQMNADERRSDKPSELAAPAENDSEQAPGPGFQYLRSAENSPNPFDFQGWPKAMSG